MQGRYQIYELDTYKLEDQTNNYCSAYSCNETTTNDSLAKHIATLVAISCSQYLLVIHVVVDVWNNELVRFCCSGNGLTDFDKKYILSKMDYAVKFITGGALKTNDENYEIFTVLDKRTSFMDNELARMVADKVINAGYADECLVSLSKAENFDPIISFNFFRTEYSRYEVIEEEIYKWLNGDVPCSL